MALCRILARAEGGPANIATDADAAAQTILSCIRKAIGPDVQIGSLRAGMGLAGANAAGALQRLCAALPFPARIETDATIAAKGALGTRDGILAALGTGSVFVRQTQGRLEHFGGWGFVLGDEGSGARLGCAALSLALRAQEGRAPMTPYLADLLSRHGGAPGVVAFSLSARPADFAALAPELLARDDPAAGALWMKSVSDVAEMLANLGASDGLPVTFTGGLGPSYARALATLPQRPACGTPLDGALMLAREVP